MRRTLLVAAAVLALGGCAKPAQSAAKAVAGPGHGSRIPDEFLAACGHPGTEVTVRKVPVTVKHDDCDLTATKITYGLAGADVPKPGTSVSAAVETFVATTEPTTITIAVDKVTLDVTVTS